MKTKAFTLIELLVVIAIIAILAAILFPVFAQAKEAAKKARVISDTKQTATSFNIYSTDADDNFPSAYAVDPATGTVLGGPTTAPGFSSYWFAAVPAGWGGRAAFAGADQIIWYNSMFPYTKNNDLYQGSGSNVYTTGFNYSTAPANLPITHMTMNGLLSLYSLTAVQDVSGTPLLWFGNGKESYRGFGYTSPYLRCTVTGTVAAPAPACRFNPGGHPQTGAASTGRQDTYEFTFAAANDTVRVYGRGNILAFTDSSAKWVAMGSDAPQALANGNRKYLEPAWTYYGPQSGYPAGNVDSPMRCQAGATSPYYLSMFRPDQQRSYQFGYTGSGAQCNP